MDFNQILQRTPDKEKVEEKPSPVIRIKEKDAKNVELLRTKLEEYKKRFDPNLPAKEQFDTIYKIAITEEVLKKGEVNTWVVEKSLAERYGASDRELFQNAREVVEDYIKTGGENLEKVN